MKTTPLENWIIQKSGIGEPSRERLCEYQLSRIRETLDYAKARSRFYAERLKGICPDEILTLDDMSKLPFTTPGDIRSDPFHFLCVPQREIKRVVTLNTTGTSGKEKRVFFSEEDLDATVEFFIYGMSCLTDNTDRVLVLLPGESRGSIGDLLKKALDRAGTDCVKHGIISDIDNVAKKIAEKDITSIVGIPSQLLKLSRTKSEVFGSRIKSVLLSADYVPEALIRELTEKFRCKVFTHYGMTETGYGGGVECEARVGYHLREAELYYEIVDPVSGRPVPDGEWGEVVFTTLTRKAMPLIRYKTGDLAAFSTERCACGTFLKTMKRVKGRLSGGVVLEGDKRLYQSELDELVLAFGELRDYKASILRDGALQLEIVTENEADFDKCRDKIEGVVRNFIHERSGSAVELRVIRKTEADRLSNSMVKRTIVDLRKGD